MTTLHQEITAETDGFDDEIMAAALAHGDQLAVRDLIARISTLDDECDRLKELAAAITERYTNRIQKLHAQADEHREAIETFLIHHNDGQKVAFPDVGTAYLSTVKAKTKVEDREAFEAWFEMFADGDGTILDGAYVHTTSFDTKAALERALGPDVIINENGHLINVDTGEFVAVPEGVEVEPERKSLRIRAAA